MLLSPEVLAIQILNFIFLIFAIVALILSIKIYKYWDINSTSNTQYKLEKQSFLAASIIKYIFALKLPLFLFFIFTLDKISAQLTGAMCAAGVVDATDYGSYLFILKIFNIYIFGAWLIIHNIDINKENLPYTKQKFALFIFIFFTLLIEIILEFTMFASIDLNMLVSCCGTIYSSAASSSTSSIFTFNSSLMVSIFYILLVSQIIITFFQKYTNIKYLFSLVNILFFLVAISSLISFFGTYIYELPTHHCPFCFLQKEYHYIGYLIYSLLFAGTFFGITVSIVKSNQKYYKLSSIFNSLYTLLVSSYVILFYIKNGVWL